MTEGTKYLYYSILPTINNCSQTRLAVVLRSTYLYITISNGLGLVPYPAIHTTTIQPHIHIYRCDLITSPDFNKTMLYFLLAFIALTVVVEKFGLVWFRGQFL